MRIRHHYCHSFVSEVICHSLTLFSESTGVWRLFRMNYCVRKQNRMCKYFIHRVNKLNSKL